MQAPAKPEEADTSGTKLLKLGVVVVGAGH